MIRLKKMHTVHTQFLKILSAWNIPCKGNINVRGTMFIKTVVSKMWSTGPGAWDSRSCQGVFQIKTIFITVLDWHLLCFFPHCVDNCADGAKTMMDKIADALTWIKAVAPNCTIFHCYLCTRKKQIKIQFPLKMSLMKQ